MIKCIQLIFCSFQLALINKKNLKISLNVFFYNINLFLKCKEQQLKINVNLAFQNSDLLKHVLQGDYSFTEGCLSKTICNLIISDFFK